MNGFPRPRYAWPAPYRAAAIVTIDVDGESPMAWHNRGRDVALLAELEQRRFGPRVGVWRLLDLLDEFGAKASFFVPGMIAEAYPFVMPGIAARGHEIGLHGWHHEKVDELDRAQNAAVLDRCIALFEAQLGRRPEGYRSPSWEITPEFHALLRERGFRFDASLQGFDHPYGYGGVTEIPGTWLVEDTIYFRFTGGPRDRTHPANPDAVLASWIEEFEGMREFGGLFTLTIHPWVSGRAQRIRLLRRLFAHMRAASDVWWTTAGEIARWHEASPNAAIHQVPIATLDTRGVVGPPLPR
jgi:peptidoglycan/xylan/chitin deacetylase (PgdA/CDA1 family)